MAPGAHILYVGASDCQDASLDQALNYVVDRHGSPMSSRTPMASPGECRRPGHEVQAFNQIAIQGALEGMTIDFSSGDNGDELADIGAAVEPRPRRPQTRG